LWIYYTVDLVDFAAGEGESVGIVITDIVVVEGVDERVALVEGTLHIRFEDLVVGEFEFGASGRVGSGIMEVSQVHYEVWM